jgi:hypothetical protein
MAVPPADAALLSTAVARSISTHFVSVRRIAFLTAVV